MKAVRSGDRIKHVPLRDGYYAVNGQLTIWARILGRYSHSSEVCQRTFGRPADCSETIVERWHLIINEETLVLQWPYRLIGSLNMAWRTGYIEVSDRHDSWTTTPLERDWSEVVSWSLQCILTVCTEYCTIATSLNRKLEKEQHLPFGCLNNSGINGLEALQPWMLSPPIFPTQI